MDKVKVFLFCILCILFLIVLGAIIWVWFSLNIAISDQSIPTVINGITSSIGIIAGFSGVVIGIMLRDTAKKDRETRQFYLMIMVCLFAPFVMLWTVYVLLVMASTEPEFAFAVRYGLSCLLLTLFILFTILEVAVKTRYSNRRHRT